MIEETKETNNQMLSFDLISEKWIPEKVKYSKGTPPSVHFHSCVVYKKKLFIFGGKSKNVENGVYSFDFG
jgi:hypothetical protein